LLFCHEDVQQEVRLNVEKSFATDRPVKMLIFGDWGVGKTHLLYNLKWWLEANELEFPTFPIIIEIGDISKKSRFDKIIGPFLEKLGRDFIVELVSRYRSIQPDMNHALREAGVGATVAKTLSMFQMAVPGEPATPQVALAFEYLKGVNVGKDGQSIGLNRSIEESSEFYHVLLAIGHMYRSVHGHRMLFIADEAARLEIVQDEAVQSHWVSANKLIFDAENRDFGFLYTVSARKNRLPKAIWEPQIENRIGENNVVELEVLDRPSVERFLKTLLSEFVDHSKVQELVSAGELKSEQVATDVYPFTQEAWADFVEYFQRTQKDSKPRDITSRLNDAAFMAGKKNSRLITPDILKLVRI
jgi:hypothetical protein